MASRRQFLTKASLLAGGGLLTSTINNSVFAIFNQRTMPSDQLNISVIGVNGMGWTNINAALNIPGINLIAICDVDQNVIDGRLNELSKRNIDTRKIIIYI